MAADITLLFRASVKTVKTRNKALGVSLPDTDVLRKSRPRGTFNARARDVINNIGKLKDFLLEHRKDYINVCSHVTSKYSRMTDTERDQIDQDAQTFMRTCFDAIQQLRTEGAAAHPESRPTVMTVWSRLEPEQFQKVKTRQLTETNPLRNTEEKEEGKPSIEETTERTVSEAQSTSGLWDDGLGEDELSPEDIQMFEEENQRLVSEMNSLLDEVRQIEGKVVEISRLQEIFTEKVLQQETEIDNIHQLVVGATENIKEGNEDIREAIKNNAGFRVWILFFLVMCSFSLLFLDWYDS
ncbi:syntaxin-18 [Pyxicephalus adspersus]|uniref:syntaxin-18 n=1 Tax=Pyxicephalus adspersus TaxID=30357 RepID=UPI003B59F8E8